MARRIDWLSIACLALAATVAKANTGATDGPSAAAGPGLALALPADSKVKVRWVCPPIEVPETDETPWYTLCFAVDASGRPWIASPANNVVLNPTQQYRFSLSHPLSGLLCLDNGALLFQTERDLGFLGLTDEPALKDGRVILPFQPAVRLPLPACRIHPGVGDCLYVAGLAPGGNQHVYLLQPQASSSDGKKVLRDFRKVFECPEPIAAVTGDGKITFLSFGRVLARVGRPGQTEPDLIVHPTDNVTDLAYLPGAGLFYATESGGLGLATDAGFWDFARGGLSQIELRNGTLYVLLEETMGVLALDHVADLARHTLAGNRTPSAPAARAEPATRTFQVPDTAPVTAALLVRDLELLRYVLARGADPDERDPGWDNCPALAWAATINVRAVQLLLDRGAQVNARSDEGHTPLFYVAQCDSPAMAVEIATTLIRHGADINVVDKQGLSLLWHMAGNGPPAVVELLLKHGANPNQSRTIVGDEIPLLVSVIMTCTEPQIATVLELLLAYGANPNAKDTASTARCPLAYAAGKPEPAFVQVLLAHGAACGAATGGFRSPLREALQAYLTHASGDRVKAQKAKDVTAILLQHGAALRGLEEPIVADARLHPWLDQDFILEILKRNDQAVLNTTDTPVPAIRRMVVNRLIGMAIAKAAAATANDGYNAALALCDQAKTRTERWQMQAQCPLVYYNTGLLYRHLGQLAAAKENFQRYLDLAPKAPEAHQIRQLLQKL